jgi:hypothetical protein
MNKKLEYWSNGVVMNSEVGMRKGEVGTRKSECGRRKKGRCEDEKVRRWEKD